MTISIIIPIYNQERYLSRCLDSILAQTFSDFEVLCIDDHSTDKSLEIIREYAKKDSRIVELENPSKGVCSARNFGIDNAHGEYIGFVDSDDCIQPQMYEFLLKAIQENDCNMVVCNYEEVESFEIKSFDYKCQVVNILDYIGNSHSWGHSEMIVAGVWSKLIKADYLRKNARFGDFRIGQDMVFCAQLWVNADKTMLVDVPLYNYFIYPDSSCHRNYEEKFLNLMRARFASYRIYKNFNEKIASYYLSKSFMLAVRCKTEKLVKNKENKKILNSHFRKMVIPFLRINDMSMKEKLIYVLKYIKG